MHLQDERRRVQGQICSLGVEEARFCARQMRHAVKRENMIGGGQIAVWKTYLGHPVSQVEPTRHTSNVLHNLAAVEILAKLLVYSAGHCFITYFSAPHPRHLPM